MTTEAETAVDVEKLSRIANYLFLQMCISGYEPLAELHSWYSDGWELIESLIA